MSTISNLPPTPSTSQPATSNDRVNAQFTNALFYLEWIGWAFGFLYVPGLFFTLLFLLLPQMDEASVTRAKLSYQEDNAPYRKKEIEYQQNLYKKNEDFRTKQRQLKYREEDLGERARALDKRERNLPESATAADREAITKERESLSKERAALDKERNNINDDAASNNYKSAKEMRPDRDKLDKDKDEWIFKKQYLMVDQTTTETSAAGRRWWYVWGLLFGTIMLMLGGIGYLSPKQGVYRRVVGAITVAAIVLMIAAKMNGGRSVIFGASVTPLEQVRELTLPSYAQGHTTTSAEDRPYPSTGRSAVSGC